MNSYFFRGLSAAAFVAFAAIAPVTNAFAQETSDNRVAARTDWSVFVDDDPTQCWAVSGPKETVNTDSDGRIKAVRRSQILMFVTYSPSAGVAGQVSFTGGYPFAEGSTVQMKIEDTTFELFTSSENAWAASPSDDAKIITAMKRGAEAELTASSARGTITRDTFSLFGFTAALDEAETRCSG